MVNSVTTLNANNVMMKLGDYKFMIPLAVYQTLERTTEWKWPSQSRFLLGPSSQFVGNGEDRITLTGVILPEWRGGTGQIDRFREMGGMGQSYLLVGGLGRIFGQWFIESVNEKQSLFAAFGTPRKQEFTLTLRKQYP